MPLRPLRDCLPSPSAGKLRPEAVAYLPARRSLRPLLVSRRRKSLQPERWQSERPGSTVIRAFWRRTSGVLGYGNIVDCAGSAIEDDFVREPVDDFVSV